MQSNVVNNKNVSSQKHLAVAPCSDKQEFHIIPTRPDGISSTAEAHLLTPSPAVTTGGDLHPQERPRRFYIPIRSKFVLTFCFSVLWASLSVYLSLPWTDD